MNNSASRPAATPGEPGRPGLELNDTTLQGLVLRIVIRLGVIAVLVVWSFGIIRPFLAPLIWAIIITVAAYRPFVTLERWCAGRSGIAAVLFVLVSLTIILVPTFLLADTLFAGLRSLATDLADGRLEIAPPPASVETWPLIGEPVHALWLEASINLQEALARLGPQLTAIGTWLLGFTGKLTLGLLQFIIAIFIAAAMLANAASGSQLAGRIATGLVGPGGNRYAVLAGQTIRSVTKGIVGVSLIQASLAGLGFLVAGIPAAGLLALLCLILSIVQIGPGLVILPVVIYGFAVLPTTTAVVFLIWSIGVAMIDNVLKPLLLGRGVALPTVVIFVGAIGGFLAYGLLGLFIGPVVLALGYTAVNAWLDEFQPDTKRARGTAMPQSR